MWLPPLACVSMWPLLAKDGLGIAYVGAVAVYIAVIGGRVVSDPPLANFVTLLVLRFAHLALLFPRFCTSYFALHCACLRSALCAFTYPLRETQ